MKCKQAGILRSINDDCLIVEEQLALQVGPNGFTASWLGCYHSSLMEAINHQSVKDTAIWVGQNGRTTCMERQTEDIIGGYALKDREAVSSLDFESSLMRAIHQDNPVEGSLILADFITVMQWDGIRRKTCADL
jgi:hypothetical protein